MVLRRTDFEHNETLFQRIAADPIAADPSPRGGEFSMAHAADPA